MHEIKIKINGDGTVDTGSKTRLRIGVESEVNRVKFIFDVDSTIEGTYHYIKFLRDDISYIYRVHNKEIVINKSILVKSGIWLFSFISTDAVIVNKQLTGSYGFISEPTEAVVLDGILTVGRRTEESEALDIIYGMNFSELRIPDSVPSIGDYFMYESRKTFTLHIGAGVKSIGGYTFYKAVIPTLTFSLESQLQTLSDYAFYNITFENEICIPASVETWGKHCFQYATAPTIMFEKNSKLTALGSYAFWNLSTLEIYLPDNLKTFSGNTYVIAHCNDLEYLWIPNTITTAIPANAIMSGNNIRTIELQSGFNISANFSNCTNLTADSIEKMLYSLKNLSGTTAKTLTLGATNLAKLNDSQIAIATNKNWTLS